MAILNKLTGAFPSALLYITIGTLITVWTVVWLAFKGPGGSDNSHFWAYGFLFTGLSILAIGLMLGRIGRSARKAEMAPEEAAPASANAEQVAAARPVVVPNNPMMGNQVVQPVAGVGGVAGAPPGTAMTNPNPQVTLPNANPAPLRM